MPPAPPHLRRGVRSRARRLRPGAGPKTDRRGVAAFGRVRDPRTAGRLRVPPVHALCEHAAGRRKDAASTVPGDLTAENAIFEMAVGVGVEPTTAELSARCSTRLSYPFLEAFPLSVSDTVHGIHAFRSLARGACTAGTDRFPARTGSLDPEIKIFLVPWKRKSLPGLAPRKAFD